MGNTCKTESSASFNDLMKINIDTVKKRTFENECRLAKVIDVYDGDTITVATRLDKHEHYRQYKFRLYGLDTPEIKPSLKMKDREVHIAAAKKVKKLLSDKILNKVVFIVFRKEEKYGRLMGTIYGVKRGSYIPKTFISDNDPINQWLINEGLALAYQGNKKENFSLEFLQNIIDTK
jgi:endonuclease YncB( thermonuclease family)